MEPGLDTLTIQEISSAVESAEEHGRVPVGYGMASCPSKKKQARSGSHAGSAASSGGSMSGGSDIEDTDLFEET